MSSEITKNKNIIISTHDLVAPIKGGGGSRTLRAACEFKRRGYNVIFIAPTDRITELNGMKIHWLHPPRKQRSQILSSLKFNFRLLLKYIIFIRTVDMVFIHNTIAAAAIPFLKKIFKFKFILDITDIHAEYLLAGKRNIFEKILTPYLLKYEYFIIKSADIIVAATKIMKEVLITKGIPADKIDVVYDGVDSENVPQQKEQGSEYGVIHLGAIDHQHGLEIFVQAIPIVIKEIPHAKFFFVGGGREYPRIKKLTEQLGVSEYCIFTDWLPQDKSREYLKKATIGVITRPHVLPNRIITTLKIYEYWASKIAVISTPLDGIKEIIANNENILWFNDGDAGDLAKKIIFLLKNKHIKEKIIHEGFTAVNKFNLAETASKITDLVLNCTEE